MSNVRDELQQWVDGVDATHEDGLADLTHDVIPVDLARRVLAEMDAALAALAEVRELRDEYRTYLDSGVFSDGIGPILSASGVVNALTEILDRSTP